MHRSWLLGNSRGGDRVDVPMTLPERRKGGYCNRRTRIRTSTIMIRAAITTLPIWNALRRSYLNLLFLLRPIVSLPAPSRGLIYQGTIVKYGGRRGACKQALQFRRGIRLYSPSCRQAAFPETHRTREVCCSAEASLSATIRSIDPPPMDASSYPLPY